jgi:hypothetical protein
VHAEGCAVVLRQLDTAQREDKVIEALGARYEIEALDQEQRQFRVVVDDTRFPDEAVVRLAGVLDEIEADWPERFAWPKAQ